MNPFKIRPFDVQAGRWIALVNENNDFEHLVEVIDYDKEKVLLADEDGNTEWVKYPFYGIFQR